jgi:hypothetical protein
MFGVNKEKITKTIYLDSTILTILYSSIKQNKLALVQSI